MSETNKLKTMRHSLMKSYTTYDATSRMEYIYEAPADAVNGQACLRTQYVYDALTTNIVKMKETTSTWVTATMDIP